MSAFDANSQVESGVILGLPISKVPLTAVLEEMDRSIKSGRLKRYISITNTESMYHGLRDANHGRYIQEADFSLCDGVGVIAAGWFWKQHFWRVNGPVLQQAAIEYGAHRGWRHFFYGGKEGVAERMAENFVNQFPGVVVCGCYSPPFKDMSQSEKVAIADEIKATRPDVVWVGLGLLKQERWIAENIQNLAVPWMVGVGAAFDYHSGAIPWAPPLLRRLGLEWIFRLILQPKLRAKRYWWSGVYVARAALQGVLWRVRGSPPTL